MLLLVSGTTKTVSGLAGQYPDRLGHLLTPANRNGMASLLKTGLWWAVDNGAFRGFDPTRFRRLLQRIGGHPRCLFVAAPDVVGDARRTLSLWTLWSVELAATGQPAAYVLQDGQEDLELPDAEAYFVGGSTRWKLSAAAADLMAEAKDRGAWVHMGRVNSLRRMGHAQEMGCDSIDGSSASMFGDRYIPLYLRWLKRLEQQPVLW